MFSRLWTRRLRWRLCLLALLYLLSGVVVRAAPPAYEVFQLRYAIDTDGSILVTYGVESASYPLVQATGGTVAIVTVPDGVGGWRSRINATLDPCRGVLALATLAQPDWQTLIHQRCTYIPLGAK